MKQPTLVSFNFKSSSDQDGISPSALGENTDEYLVDSKDVWAKKPFQSFILTHSHTMTPFDAPGKQAF